ncbi:MAG: succinate dehydrogenase assembly factor 2 [Xanthomonadales bacterium]|nr:succinate dehydrogenase assembly factor 2 [Xanthomonadales bacterium]
MSELARLRWRARRGTRELDRLLGWWLDERHPAADEATRSAFAALLDCPDPDLWDWLTGHAEPEEPRFAAIIDEIRAAHRV